MRIGITVDMRHSMFSAGHPNSCIAVCEAMQVGGHDVIFLKKDDKIWWDDVLEIAKDYTVKSIDDVSDLDILIEVAFHPTALQRSKLAKKCIWYCRKSALFTDIESTVFGCRIEGRDLEGITEIWASNIYNCQDDIDYLKTLYPSILIHSVPWLWSSTIVEAHRKERQSPVWPQVIEHLAKEIPWSLHITETNASNTSSCTLPLLMAEGSDITKIYVHNTEQISKSKFFKDNILENCSLPESLHLVGRQRIIDWSHEPKSVIISHSRFIQIKQANLEAVWVGIPLIHNNELLGELGCGLEDLYYNANSIGSASKVFKKLLKSSVNDSYMYNIDTLTELRKRILYKYSPEANASSWLSLLEKKEELIIVKPKKVYTILFTDMWSEFNPEHNMFTLAMQEYLKDYTVIGTSVEGGHDAHIFGPFGSDWLSIKGPKVHFTGENTGPIEHPSVKLNIGYKNLQENYLRMPLWMFEIDWFGADLQKIRNPLPLPIDRCTGVNLQTRPKFCAFVVSNPKNFVRNEAFHTLNKYKPVDSAGLLFNNVGSTIFAGLGGGGGELKKHEFLRDYKFCLCYENEQGDGYVTEKILHAKAAGCIPIYWGSSDVVKDFDINGFIHIRDPSELVAKVKEIDEDDEKWFEMAKVPALSSAKVEEVKNTFQEMCQKIVSPTDMLLVTSCSLKFLPYLAKWLENIEQHKISMPNLKAYVFLANDIDDSIVPKKDFATYVKFPVDTPVNFPDFWNPQHFAWKLWLLKEVSCDIFLKGSTVFYMDCASIIVRWPSFWVEKVKSDKISFLDDSTQQNSQWCHKDFCDIMKVSEEELNANQIAACLIMFRPGEPFVMDFFTEALRLGSIRNIIVGEKCLGIRQDGKPHGHRHDQSILSILGQRRLVPRIKLDLIYNHTSARSTFYSGQHIYVYRGDYKSHIPLFEGIDDAYVINLDRRVDRLKSFIDYHPYFRGKVRRHKAVDGISLHLTPKLSALLKPNDFFWKKAVSGCALSHLKLWTMLYNDCKEIQTYLIMEDDVRLKPNWSEAWLKVQSKIPSGWECVYLGGVLPPNKDGLKQVLEETGVPGLCRIAPNTFFGQSVPSRQFHFCAYGYILSRAGVNRIMEELVKHNGIWTSADHVLFNSLNKENVFLLNPLVAHASQEDDPVYVNSDFNDFSRIDKFDSDLWNNDERFASYEINILDKVPLNISEAVDDAYRGKRVELENNKMQFVALDTCGINNKLYEIQWLEYLFSQKIQVESVSKEKDLSNYQNLVVLLIKSKWAEQYDWLNTIKRPYKVLHMSDEHENDPIFYDRPEVSGVMRFYPRKDLALNTKVLTIPLGYHWQNNKPIKTVGDRKYKWSFHGTDWMSRSEQIKPLLEIEPNRVEFYNDWNSPSQLAKEDYLDLLSDTVFIACPRGNNIETFRLYEALESGCIPVFTEIPVILHDSGIPFLRTETWLEVASLMKHLINNPEQLHHYQVSLVSGWMHYKERLRKKVLQWTQ